MIFAKILRNAAAKKLAKTVTKNNLRVGKYVARYLPRLEIQQKFALVCQVSISETCSYILRHCVVNTVIILITNITTITIIVLIIITTFSPSSQNPSINAAPHTFHTDIYNAICPFKYFVLAKILLLFHEGDDDNMMKYAGKFATTNRKIHHRNPSWTTILPEHAKSRHIRHFTICSVQYALCNMQYHVFNTDIYNAL